MIFARKQWPKLTMYVEDGHLEMENNLTEKSIRPFIIGRKDWLSCHRMADTNASVNAYSPIETTNPDGNERHTNLQQY